MYLPISVMVYDDRCSADPGGKARWRMGTTMATAIRMVRNTTVPRSPRRRLRTPPSLAWVIGSPPSNAETVSCFRRAALLREQPARTALNEQNECDQHEDLRQHRA